MRKLLLASVMALFAAGFQSSAVCAEVQKTSTAHYDKHKAGRTEECGEASLQTKPDQFQIPVGISRVTYNNLLVPPAHSSKTKYSKGHGYFKVTHDGIYTIEYLVQAYGPPTELPGEGSPFRVTLMGQLDGKNSVLDRLTVDAAIPFSVGITGSELYHGHGKVTVRLKAGEKIFVQINNIANQALFFGSPSGPTTGAYLSIQKVK